MKSSTCTFFLTLMAVSAILFSSLVSAQPDAEPLLPFEDPAADLVLPSGSQNTGNIKEKEKSIRSPKAKQQNNDAKKSVMPKPEKIKRVR